MRLMVKLTSAAKQDRLDGMDVVERVPQKHGLSFPVHADHGDNSDDTAAMQQFGLVPGCAKERHRACLTSECAR